MSSALPVVQGGGASLRSFVPATELTTSVNSVAGTILRPPQLSGKPFPAPLAIFA